jgi:phosphodiesterase/alkaline phosphatase D-like protein
MNTNEKNSVIGLLAAIVVLGGGYLIWKNTSPDGSANPPTASVGEIVSPSSSNSSSNTPSTTRTADAPVVKTDSEAVASNSMGVLNGTVNPNGASATYWYEYGKTTELGNRTTAQAIGSGFTALQAPAYITGLSPNTLYYFRLSAKNVYATVNGTTYSFRTNTNPPPEANAPTVRAEAASNVSRTTANLSGSINPNGSDTRYWFEYGNTTDFGRVTAVQFAGSGVAPTSASISLSGLEPLTRYYFRLNAQNQYGTVNGTVLSFMTSGPVNSSAPSVETNSAVEISTSEATLRGHVNPNGAETTYWFEYGPDSLLSTLYGSTSTPEFLNGMSSLSVQARLGALERNTRYYYQLVARNQYGTVRNNIESFTTAR